MGSLIGVILATGAVRRGARYGQDVRPRSSDVDATGEDVVSRLAKHVVGAGQKPLGDRADSGQAVRMAIVPVEARPVHQRAEQGLCPRHASPDYIAVFRFTRRAKASALSFRSE